MKYWLTCVVLLLATLTFSVAEDKGTCPPAPPPGAFDLSKKIAKPTTTDSQGNRIATITLLAVVSDKGYICSARVIQGLERKADAEAVKAVLKWHLPPATKDGHAVPTVATIEAKYRIDKNGNVTIESPKPEANQPH
jgi:hypothetical protein